MILQDTQKPTQKQKSPKERIQAIAENWFLCEPLLFNAYCTHKIVVNEKLSIPFRTGNMKIEFNPVQVKALSDSQIEDYLKAEIIRILLKHPYERVPGNANRIALGFASDVTVEQAIALRIPILNYKELGLERGLSYEEYYRELKDRPITQPDYGKSTDDTLTDNDNQPSAQTQANEKAELWQEDEFAVEEINTQIKKAMELNQWGSVSGDLKQIIEASLVVSLDYRKILSSFRASVLSQKRQLTRMKPNRRYEFLYMGSRFAFTTRLLIAVDVSGSVNDKSLSQFFSVINRFFKYGISSIEVIQFDYGITQEIQTLRKARKSVKITGRGGTNFQAPIDYYSTHTEYDGLILFTDGCADIPRINTRRRILWILTSKQDYENSHTWIEKFPNNRAIWISE